jgi:hypothetical protein
VSRLGDEGISSTEPNDGDEQFQRLLVAVPVVVGIVAGAIAIVQGPAWAVGLLAGAAIAMLVPPLRRAVLRREPDRRGGAIVLVVAIVGGGIGLLIGGSGGAPTITSPRPDLEATGYKHGKWYEQEGEGYVEVFGKPGVHSTVIDRPIKPFEIVHVKCRIYSPGVKSAGPEYNWYLIASPPWNGRGYAAANAFWNNSKVREGPGVHNTDKRVPTCESLR